MDVNGVCLVVLVDMSQVMYSNLFVHLRPGQPIEKDLIRHMVLNSLRSYKQKHETKFGRLVLCFDSRDYWRKLAFPFYKSHRKKERDDSGFDWDTIHECFNEMYADLKAYFPYQTLEVSGCEADDIIGVLAKKCHLSEKILILSGDKDFPQLQKFKNIWQYAPTQGEWMKTDDPGKFLKLHIMKGDRGDGVPNFLSPDDCLFKKIRQKNLPREDKLNLWATLPPERFCTTDMLHGWYRNEMMIDLEKIPEIQQVNILDDFKKPFDSSNGRIVDYFLKKRLKQLLEHVGQFKVNNEKKFIG